MLKDGITYLIFAWNDNDPDCHNNWSYHGEKRITQTFLLLNYKSENHTEEEKLPANTMKFELRVKEVRKIN